MRLVIKMFLILLALFMLPAYALGDIYKCKDKKGRFHITDNPSTLPKECIEQSTYTSDKAPASRGTSESTINIDEIEKWSKLLPGTWVLKGNDAGETYTIVWTISSDGQFTGTGSGQAGQGAFTWRYSGTWKISYGNLISTYSWSSAPVPKPGTQDIDTIIELSESSLILREGKSGSISKYTRKSR